MKETNHLTDHIEYSIDDEKCSGILFSDLKNTKCNIQSPDHKYMSDILHKTTRDSFYSDEDSILHLSDVRWEDGDILRVKTVHRRPLTFPKIFVNYLYYSYSRFNEAVGKYLQETASTRIYRFHKLNHTNSDSVFPGPSMMLLSLHVIGSDGTNCWTNIKLFIDSVSLLSDPVYVIGLNRLGCEYKMGIASLEKMLTARRGIKIFEMHYEAIPDNFLHRRKEYCRMLFNATDIEENLLIMLYMHKYLSLYSCNFTIVDEILSKCGLFNGTISSFLLKQIQKSKLFRCVDEMGIEDERAFSVLFKDSKEIEQEAMGESAKLDHDAIKDYRVFQFAIMKILKPFYELRNRLKIIRSSFQSF